jgi:NAD(P)-dependent dehydrogenase (short-subunit alcohol dehydrogenase family)
MRLKDKIAIVVGAGQSPGEGLGNGRATVLHFAQEGANSNLGPAVESPCKVSRNYNGISIR